MKDPYAKGDRGPGVPEAIPRGIQRLGAELGVETLDRVWIFPPLISGRRESGLLAVSRFKDEGDPDRRVLTVLPYSAERTGKGLTLESSLEEHGEAPLDRLPRVMEGVVKRAESDLGEPREVEIGGSEERFLACLGEFDQGLLDPQLPPLGEPPLEASPPENAPGVAPAAPVPVEGSGPVPGDDPFDLYVPESAL